MTMVPSVNLDRRRVGCGSRTAAAAAAAAKVGFLFYDDDDDLYDSAVQRSSRVRRRAP